MMLPDWLSLRWKARRRGLAPHLSPSTDRAAAIGAGQARAYRSWPTTAGAADDPKLAATSIDNKFIRARPDDSHPWRHLRATRRFGAWRRCARSWRDPLSRNSRRI